MAAFAWVLIRRGDATQRDFGWAVAALAAWQLVTGLSNVVLDWPIVAALAHTGGAGATLVVLTALLVRTRVLSVVPDLAEDERTRSAVPRYSPIR
jgi:cytochrome c oxidase assembly protein subunit 15